MRRGEKEREREEKERRTREKRERERERKKWRGKEERMARGCTCALFSSGPAFLKIFPAAAALSADLSRRVDPVDSQTSSGNRATGKTIEKLALSRHSRRLAKPVYNFDEFNFLYVSRARTREKERYPQQTMHLTSIVATLLSRIKRGETTFVSFIASKCGMGSRATRCAAAL